MKTLKKLGVISLVITLFTLASCKNELEVNGPLTDKLAVYGLINWTDTAHYLKIYKTFLTDENIYVAAQNPDNYLLYDSIEVLLIENDNGILKYHLFDTTTIIPKDSGMFSNPAYPNRQVLYVNKDHLTPTSFYMLQIKNKYTGELRASSGCISDCVEKDKIKLPYPSTLGIPSDSANPLRINPKYLMSANANGTFITTTNFKINKPVTNGYRYEAYYHFYYWEKDDLYSNDSTLKGPIKIEIGTKSVTSDNITPIEIPWNPSIFFSKVAKALPTLPPNSPVVRGTGPVHLFVWAAGKDYSDFITNNSQVSLSIIEDRPSISNISNGVGLFSSRYLMILNDCRLHQNTIAVLLNNPSYAPLHFYF
jgi:hypothetical protein